MIEPLEQNILALDSKLSSTRVVQYATLKGTKTCIVRGMTYDKFNKKNGVHVTVGHIRVASGVLVLRLCHLTSHSSIKLLTMLIWSCFHVGKPA